jgi:hypothetical protein
MLPNDRLGSKPVSLELSNCFPICPRKRTDQWERALPLIYDQSHELHSVCANTTCEENTPRHIASDPVPA